MNRGTQPQRDATPFVLGRRLDQDQREVTSGLDRLAGPGEQVSRQAAPAQPVIRKNSPDAMENDSTSKVAKQMNAAASDAISDRPRSLVFVSAAPLRTFEVTYQPLAKTARTAIVITVPTPAPERAPGAPGAVTTCGVSRAR